MKVLFLSNIPAPYRVDFFNELGKLCDLTVLYERKNADDRETTWFKNSAKTYIEIFLNGVKVGNDAAICFGVLKYLSKNKFDIIVVGGYSTPTGMLAIEYMRLKNILFTLSCDGGMVKTDSILRLKVKKHFIGAADMWLSTSTITDKYLVNYGASKNKIFRYPFTSLFSDEILSTPFTKEQKNDIKKHLGLKNEKIILSVGQFIYRKGFDVLINSMKNINKNCSLYIVGGEAPIEYLVLRDKLALANVFFIDFMNKDQLKKYYLAADLFVLPTREDVWGLVINEAMANGLPVITTNKCVSGLELIENFKNGFIVPVDNIDQLSEKISIILNDALLAEDMASNNLKKISDYTIENMARRHVEIIKGIANV